MTKEQLILHELQALRADVARAIAAVDAATEALRQHITTTQQVQDAEIAYIGMMTEVL